MLAADALETLAHAVKLAVEDYYTAQGVSLPTVRKVVPGLPAYDCEQLAVQILALTPHGGDVANPGGTDADPLGLRHSMRLARVGLYLVRCIPGLHDDGTGPTVVEDEASAGIILRDGIMLLGALLSAQAEGRLPGCKGVALDEWINLEPSGGLGGGAMQVSIDLSSW